MPSWKIHLLTAAILIAPTLHASVTSGGTTVQNDVPLGSWNVNYYYGPTQNYQANFSNVGVPTYPIMGTTTVYNTSSTPTTTTTTTETPDEPTAPTPNLSVYNSTSLVQQIVNNYNQNLVYQEQQNVNNPTNTGYGYVYSTPSISTSTYTSTYTPPSSSNYGSPYSNYSYYGPTGPPPALMQQVSIITSSYNSGGTNTAFLDAPVTENPEPGTILLLAGGLGAMIAIRRKLRKI